MQRRVAKFSKDNLLVLENPIKNPKPMLLKTSNQIPKDKNPTKVVKINVNRVPHSSERRTHADTLSEEEINSLFDEISLSLDSNSAG